MPTSADTHPQPPRTGRTFGKYEIVEELPGGGMGRVYKARDPELDRLVALKMIRAGILAGPEEVERFGREARAAARLNHPHIIPVHDVGQHEGQHYFTMAFAPGGNLAKQRARFHDDPAAAVGVVEKIARAVHYAHGKGILHRDLKPGNVLLDEHGEPLVSDFGLAKFLDASVDITKPDQKMGTPAYMAPEQAAGKNDRVGPQTDVWALGVILFELLTNCRPFTGSGDQEVTQRILTTEPLSPRRLRPGLDRPLETIVLKCLEKEPARRFASAEALADDLARWRRGEPIKTQRDGFARRTLRAWRRHRRLVTETALLLGLVGLVALAVAYFSHPDRRLEALQRRLARREPATLIDAKGPPAWSNWVVGQPVVKETPDGPYAVQTWQHCLVELLPRPLPDRYRFRAEVQHTESTYRGHVGIYLAHEQHTAPSGFPVHSFCTLDFNDVEKGPANQNRVGVHVRLYWEQEGEARADHRWTCGASTTFTPTGRKSKVEPWHKLAVEVRGHQVQAFWEGQPIGGPLTSDQWRKTAETALRPQGPIPLPAIPEYSPQGGLGLFVFEGSACFRSVVVEPLVE
jgi:serine/threonine-protein kinase